MDEDNWSLHTAKEIEDSRMEKLKLRVKKFYQDYGCPALAWFFEKLSEKLILKLCLLAVVPYIAYACDNRDQLKPALASINILFGIFVLLAMIMYVVCNKETQEKFVGSKFVKFWTRGRKITVAEMKSAHYTFMYLLQLYSFIVFMASRNSAVFSLLWIVVFGSLKVKTLFQAAIKPVPYIEKPSTSKGCCAKLFKLEYFIIAFSIIWTAFLIKDFHLPRSLRCTSWYYCSTAGWCAQPWAFSADESELAFSGIIAPVAILGIWFFLDSDKYFPKSLFNMAFSISGFLIVCFPLPINSYGRVCVQQVVLMVISFTTFIFCLIDAMRKSGKMNPTDTDVEEESKKGNFQSNLPKSIDIYTISEAFKDKKIII